MAQMVDEVLPSEAGRIIGCSSQRIRQLVDAGQLAARRGPGGIRMIQRHAVEKLAQQRKSPTGIGNYGRVLTKRRKGAIGFSKFAQVGEDDGRGQG